MVWEGWLDSLLASVDDSEVFIDGAVTVHTSLESVEHLVSLNELAKDGLVTIKVGSGTKGNREFGAAGVLSVVRQSEHSTLVVSHGHVFVLEAESESARVLFTDLAT